MIYYKHNLGLSWSLLYAHITYYNLGGFLECPIVQKYTKNIPKNKPKNISIYIQIYPRYIQDIQDRYPQNTKRRRGRPARPGPEDLGYILDIFEYIFGIMLIYIYILVYSPLEFSGILWVDFPINRANPYLYACLLQTFSFHRPSHNMMSSSAA